jgi:hypothetical protein
LDGVVTELCGVITPRNEAETIAAQIEALQRRCLGIVVVDDGSTDGTPAAAEAAGARVLVLPAPSGEGAALKAGLRLARELGYIAAVVPLKETLTAEVMDALAVAYLTAPEAILLAVGRGEAIAGKEWEAAAAIARGEEPTPYSDFRPPRAPGLHGRVETLFEAVVETRYAHPWGSPRVLPLQPVLRRRLRQNGAGIHMELLALAVKAGTPTIEVEVAVAPQRLMPTCKRAAITLIREFVPLVAMSRLRDRIGLGSGYAPPTMSPLLLALGAALTLVGVGCVKRVTTTSLDAPCVASSAWPGAGDADAARDQLVAAREAISTLMVDQGITYRESADAPPQRLRGILATDGPGRLRLRLVAAMATPILDYVEAEGRWALTVPMSGVAERGEGTPSREPGSGPLATTAAGLPLVRLVALLRSLDPAVPVRWAPGACAVLQQLDASGDPVRSLRFLDDGGWIVAEDRLLERGLERVLVTHTDYRAVTEGGPAVWPYRSEIHDIQGGSVVLLETKAVRTEGFAHVFTLPESF